MADNVTVEQLQKLLAEEKEAHAKTKAEAKKTIAEMQSKLEKKQNAKKHFGTFKLKETEYAIAYPQLELDGEVVTAEEIEADEKIQARLVELGSGAIIDLAAEKTAKEKAAKKANPKKTDEK